MIGNLIHNIAAAVNMQPVVNALRGKSKMDWVERVKRYRSAGAAADGIHTLSQPTVDDIDYRLMGADNSCAEANFPGQDVRQNMWFAINQRSELAKRHFFNSHGTSHDGGKTYLTEVALMDIPLPQFQVSPEEVVWHLRRVDELRKNGIDRPERISTMTAERATRPWAA